MAYVYGHYKAYTDELFYIGKGTGNRAWSKRSRNPHWQNVVNKHGLVVKILEDGLTEEQAYEKEKQLIAEVGLENLTNMVKGGKGFTSEDAKRWSQDPEWKQKNLEANRKRVQNPETKQKISESVKRYWEQKRLMKS